MNEIRLIFLISLPRSGSTLLQKMLEVNPEICSISEPWLLLPLANMNNCEMIVSQYWQSYCSIGISGLINKLPEGNEDYNKCINEFVNKIYQKLTKASCATYFLDKTPRYFLILPFIKEVFPNAKIIFLVRHPLDVYSSILKTWHRNYINPTLMNNYIDVMKGPKLMAKGMESYSDTAHIIKYENLITDSENVLRKLCSYLEINFKKEMLTDYKKSEFSGSMGDTVGLNKYDNISSESIQSWKTNIHSPFRKWYMRRYINYLGNYTLKSFGFDIEKTLTEIDSIKVHIWKGWIELLGYISLKCLIRINRAFIGPYRLYIKKLLEKNPMPYG